MTVAIEQSRRLTLGGYAGAPELRKALKADRVTVTPMADEMLDHITYWQRPCEVRVAFRTVHGLGLVDGASRKTVYDVALKSERLLQVPDELVPILRLEYSEQQGGEWVHAVMHPITMPDGTQRAFSLGCRVEGSRRLMILGATDGRLDGFWHAARLAAFMMEERSTDPG